MSVTLEENLFDSLLQSGVFPDLMNIAIVSPVFKTCDTADVSNYRPISVFPEIIMYNRLYKYLTNKKILHPQQFGFRKGHSTEHAIAQLVDQIYESFENDNTPLTFWLTCQRRLIQSIILHF